MKLKELKSLSKENLEKKLHDLKLELMKTRVQLTMGSDPKLSGKVRQLKKTIARIKTLLSEE